MAFLDDGDLKPAPVAPAHRSLLVPLLLLVLIVAVVALTAVLALPYLKQAADTPEDQPATKAQIDPSMLVTPTGRKLDAVEFGGFMFEITRMAYSNVPRARSVTITAPGNPPQMGVFHIGESFAGGKIRVVEITSSSVVLEADGNQKVFAIYGADPGDIWDKGGSGTQIIPPRDNGVIPDLPDGAVRAPNDPREDIEEEAADDDRAKIESIEDLPDVRPVSLARVEYQKLVREMPDSFERDFVLALAIDHDTSLVYGMEIKNLVADSFWYAHGLELGDVIVAINDQPVCSIRELDAVLKSNSFRDEIVFDIEREGSLVTFVFHPGVSD